MDKIGVFAPSYKRADMVKTHLILSNVIYVVMESEAKDYRARGLNVRSIPDEVQGNVARVRNYILENCIGEKGVMVDDDLEMFKRWDFENGMPIQKQMAGEDVMELIENGFIMLEESGFKLFGLNIIGDKGSYREYTPISFTNWVSGSFMGIIKTDIRFDERIPLKEDYDFCLQHLNKYRGLLRFNSVSMVKKDHGNVGGCADMRTLQFEREQMELFTRKWGTKIVKQDTTKKKGMKKEMTFDINPVIKVPIKGV